MKLRTRSGGDVEVDGAALEGLASGLRGELMTADSDGYDDVRVIWNAMIDRRPGAIVRCRGVADVIRGVDFAREHDLLIAVRGVGHNIAGNAVADDTLLIDLSQMTSVRVDPKARTARVEPGATLGDVDHETQAFALATPVGINSTTGISGLTLGGGFGWISRKHGLTIDNLLSADVVTADGDVVTANETSHSDLFWGIRGGGGNFGIATSFEFQLHPVGPEVTSGLIVHPAAAGPDLLRFYRGFAADAPDELTVWVVMRKAPPLPFLDESVHGTDIIALAALYVGDMAEGETALAPLREFGSPLGDAIAPHPYTGFQQAFDPLLTPGARNYWKSHNFASLSDELIDTLLRYAGDLPSPQSEVFIAQMGGATSRVAPDATAYRGRDAAFTMNIHTRWEDAADDDRCRTWARGAFDATAPMATGGVYVNFMPDDEAARVASAYGANHARMVDVKRKYDPDNRFRLNQNVSPNGA